MFSWSLLAGSVAILLQKSQDYKVLAVEVDAHVPVPEKYVPIFAASIEECASTMYLYLVALCFGPKIC